MKTKLSIAGVLFLLAFQSCDNRASEELSSQNGTIKVSSSKGNNLARLSFDSKSLSGYISNQLALQLEVKNLLDNEKNVDYSLIQSELQNVETIEQLELLYKNANILHGEELISLYNEMNSNSEIFINNNKDFYTKYTQDQRSTLIIEEIDRQLGYDDNLAARVNCHANFVKASNRCMRNYAISMTGVAVSGFFSFGVSTVVGGAVATTMMVMCNSDADEDYHDCVKGGGQP